MRRITTTSTVGKVNVPTPLSKEFALLAVLLAAVAWVGYAFAQEVFLNHRLNAQAAGLRQQNSIIATQNEGYRRDLMASAAGAAADEDARQHGYARSDERVYVVGRPPAHPVAIDGALAPTTNLKSPSKLSTAPTSMDRGGKRGLWQSINAWLTGSWRR
ncbi:MAG: hypothetical protein M3Z13_06375 [Candidatus Dormibacteraeota bacterium]|nr:hypothetical protein [Candidatus Dormibacteraeota bacterium]